MIETDIAVPKMLHHTAHFVMTYKRHVYYVPSLLDKSGHHGSYFPALGRGSMLSAPIG